ncbi:MAG: glycosyltransferase family 39 protein [Anaerolineae bacterium]|nr:glycosyltransferase family 39 protein [Anaerolineae bacterium]
MPALQEVPTPVQFTLLVGGVLLLGYGLGGAPPLNPLRIRLVWSTVIPLGVILALALFLRAWQNDVSLTYLLDELHYSDAVLGLEGRPYQPILMPMSGQATDPWVYPFLVTNTVAVLGHTFAGFRFTSAIIGILTVLATYGLAAAMFDRKTALLGALILATLPPHVHFSRVTQSLITDPLFGTLALMFVARALRKNHRIEWAMAGVALGLTQYFYEGGRLLFPPLMLGFIVFLALNGKMRGKWRGGLTMLAIFVIVAIPIYYTLIGNGKPLFGRYDVSGVGTSYWQDMFASGINLDTLQQLAKHLLSSFMMFGAHPDMSAFYGGEQALVLDYLLPFFLFGVFYLLWRYPASVVIVPIWIAVTGLGNGVMRDTLASTRYYVVLPAVALAITSGVRYLFPFVWGDGQPSAEGAIPRGTVVRWAIPAVAIGAIAAAQVGYYFGPHLAYFNVQVREAKGYRDGIDAVNRALALPGNTQIFLVGRPAHDQNVPRNWLGFLSQDGDPMRYFPLLAVTPDTISAKYLNDLPRGVNYAFYVDPTLNDLILLLQRTFPGISQAMYSPFSVPAHKEYVLFFVPSETIPLSLPLKPSLARP